MDHARKGHITERNTIRSMGERRDLSWPSRIQNVRDNMSDFGMIYEGRPFSDGLDTCMFKKDCCKCILPEKSTLWGGTQLGARKKVKALLVQPGPG